MIISKNKNIKDKFCKIISVAPMMGWTDRHCQSFHRIISKKVWLYTEMMTTSSLMHKNLEYKFDDIYNKSPISLQLAGNTPKYLAYSAKLGEKLGFSQINLNCGCPSNKVYNGKFGAYMMQNKKITADCIKAMCDAVSIPITVKHRIGIEPLQEYSLLQEFVEIISNAGCSTFIVHARNAIINYNNINTKNIIPPLKYNYVYKLKKDFPNLNIIINGGIKTLNEAKNHLKFIDGVMIGREAYYNPYILSDIDEKFYKSNKKKQTRKEIIEKIIKYCEIEFSNGTSIRNIIKHIFGLYYGISGSKKWKKTLSNSVNDLSIFKKFLLK